VSTRRLGGYIGLFVIVHNLHLLMNEKELIEYMEKILIDSQQISDYDIKTFKSPIDVDQVYKNIQSSN
jgi:hypothetical protein